MVSFLLLQEILEALFLEPCVLKGETPNYCFRKKGKRFLQLLFIEEKNFYLYFSGVSIPTVTLKLTKHGPRVSFSFVKLHRSKSTKFRVKV